jgi:predicted ATPase
MLCCILDATPRSRLSVGFKFDHNGYCFSLEPTADNRLIFANEYSTFFGNYKPTEQNVLLGSGHSESKLKTATAQYSPYVREAVQNWRIYHFHDTSDTAKVKQKHAANDNLRLKTDAANLAAYLRMLKLNHVAHHTRIVETIRLVLPFFDDFVHRPGEPDFIELEWLQKGHPDTPLKAHMLSDGSLRFISLTTLLLQPVKLLPATVLIDEPELGLHPYAITVMADMFKQVDEERQLIVSTQSVELVNEPVPEDVIVVDQNDSASVFSRLSSTELAGWLEQYALGELWKQNVLGGRP